MLNLKGGSHTSPVVLEPTKVPSLSIAANLAWPALLYSSGEVVGLGHHSSSVGIGSLKNDNVSNNDHPTHNGK